MLDLLVWGIPPLPCWHTVRWEHTLSFGGVPPFLHLQTVRGGCARPPWGTPPPPYRARDTCAAGAGGSLSTPGPGHAVGACAAICGGPPPGPLLRAVGARCWVGVPLPLSPPSRALALSARDRSGESSSLVSGVSLSARGKRAAGFSPFLRLPLVLVPCGPVAGRAPWVSPIGLVDCHPCRR